MSDYRFAVKRGDLWLAWSDPDAPEYWTEYEGDPDIILLSDLTVASSLAFRRGGLVVDTR